MSDKKEQKAEESVSVEDYRQALEEEIKEFKKEKINESN